MAWLSDIWSKEPAVIVALVVALTEALAVPDVWAKVVMAALAVIGGVVTRSQVYSPATVAADIKARS